MTGFAEGLRMFEVDVAAGLTQLLPDLVTAAKESIVEGSPITGSPGQPVGQYGPGYNEGSVGGTLKDSWTEEFLSPTKARIVTNVVYAEGIEDGVGPHGPIQIRSTVGGTGSVAKTVAGWPRLVEHVVAQRRGDA